MNRLLALVVVALFAFVVAGCGDDTDIATKPSTPPEASAATGETGKTAETADEGASADTGSEESGCKKVKQPEPKDDQLSKPKKKLDPKKAYFVDFETSCGKFTIKLDVKNSPKTSASVAYMAEKGFYDKTIFHRVVPGFVVQGGDPLGTGSGGPGYKVVEAPPKDAAYGVGVVAMAKAGNEDAGTSGSQFFVVSGAQGSSLTPDYAILGKLVKGQETIDAISALGEGDGPPSQVVELISANLRTR